MRPGPSGLRGSRAGRTSRCPRRAARCRRRGSSETSLQRSENQLAAPTRSPVLSFSKALSKRASGAPPEALRTNQRPSGIHGPAARRAGPGRLRRAPLPALGSAAQEPPSGHLARGAPRGARGAGPRGRPARANAGSSACSASNWFSSTCSRLSSTWRSRLSVATSSLSAATSLAFAPPVAQPGIEPSSTAAGQARVDRATIEEHEGFRILTAAKRPFQHRAASRNLSRKRPFAPTEVAACGHSRSATNDSWRPESSFSRR